MDREKQLSENECTINPGMANRAEICSWMKVNNKSIKLDWLCTTLCRRIPNI
jgi:hypothetical protein